jgi:nitrogen regulatory protein PII
LPKSICHDEIEAMMKKIDAIVKTSQFAEIVDRLRLIGVTGLTAAEVHGFSPNATTSGSYLGQAHVTSSVPRYMITVFVTDDDVASIVNAIRQRGQTNSPGDGIITVSDTLEAIRIRTGERGVDAL